MAEKERKVKVRKVFKNKHIIDDDSTGTVIRIVTPNELTDFEADRYIKKIIARKV